MGKSREESPGAPEVRHETRDATIFHSSFACDACSQKREGVTSGLQKHLAPQLWVELDFVPDLWRKMSSVTVVLEFAKFSFAFLQSFKAPR
jgi:hypothetical protein